MIVILLPIVVFGQRFPVDLQQIKEVCNSDVSEITFSHSRGSCFNAYNETTTFYRQFLHYTTDSSFGNLLFPENTGKPAKTISGLNISIFIHSLPAILTQPMTIGHMEFTEQQYEQCKREIDTMRSSYTGHQQLKLQYHLFRQEEVDYQRLSVIPDSLPLITPDRLLPLLLSDKYSSMSNSWNVLLKNTNGTYINISHSSSYTHPMLTYWMVDINGEVSFSNNMEITQFFEKNFPGFPDFDKMVLLRWLVMKLYQSAPVNPCPATVSRL